MDVSDFLRKGQGLLPGEVFGMGPQNPGFFPIVHGDLFGHMDVDFPDFFGCVFVLFFAELSEGVGDFVFHFIDGLMMGGYEDMMI